MNDCFIINKNNNNSGKCKGRWMCNSMVTQITKLGNRSSPV